MSDFIKWRDAWLFGIDHLDNQHRELADLLNRLVRECTCAGQKKTDIDDQKKQLLRGMLDELYTRTRQHFQDEEAMMATEGYPGYIQHAREHTMLLGEFKSTFRAKLDEGCCNMNPGTLTALKSWFVVHVACSDRKFSEYLATRRSAGKAAPPGNIAAQPGSDH